MTFRHAVIPAYLVLCLLLGGASSGGYMSNLVLQLIALPIILWSLMRDQPGQPPAARALLILAALAVIVVLIQLIPLPPAVWTSLPGRERIAEGYALLGHELPWLPLSLARLDTLAALLWLLPALAVLLGILRLGAYRATILAWSLVAVTIASVLVSALQLSGGANNPFYFYEVTNRGFGVGFFASANHQATLLICTIPFVAALFVSRKRSHSVKGSSGLATALTGIALILAVGVAINGSLAGLGLGVGVALMSFLLLRYRSRRVPAWAPAAALIAMVGAVAFLLVGPLSGGGLLKELETSAVSRQELVTITAGAAADYLPVGSGVGTFAGIYRTYEDPATITYFWANHAHSDFVEIVLESGIFGALLLLAFLFWWGRRAFVIWIKDERPDHFARAAVIASAAVIAHSMVDYPLRTAGLSALFAVCVALMAQPRPSARARTESSRSSDEIRHLSA